MTELWRSLLEAEPGLDRAAAARLADAVAELGSPEGVREVVSQRLARLSPATTAAARAGSGRRTGVRPRDHRDRRARPIRTLRVALEQAIAHGMIEEVPSRRLAYRFTHELVRRALYDRMPTLRRAELHLQVAEALERSTRVGGDDRGLAELAHHFGAAAPIDGPRERSSTRSSPGRAALAALDFDEAEARFSYALELGIDDPRRRARDAARARDRPLPGRPLRRRDGRLPRRGAQIARDLGDAGAARDGRGRLRGCVLAARHRTDAGSRRAPRRGVASRSAPRTPSSA